MTDYLREAFWNTVKSKSGGVPKAYKRYVQVNLKNDTYSKSLDHRGYVGNTSSGQKVYFTKTTVLGGFNGRESLSHAILFRDTIFVGYTHADAIEKMLNIFAGTPKEKEELTDVIDNDKEPMEIGYFYDNKFSVKPKDNSMKY